MPIEDGIGPEPKRQQSAFKLGLLFSLLLAAGLWVPCGLQAQQYLGTLSGSVMDATGAKVVGANVLATDVATKFLTRAVTNGAGEYTIPSLTPDTYTVTVTASGFRSESLTGVELTAATRASARFRRFACTCLR